MVPDLKAAMNKEAEEDLLKSMRVQDSDDNPDESVNPNTI